MTPGEVPPSQRYRVGEILGRGGMSVVYRAYDEVLGRAVALKFLDEGDPVSTHRFLREARAQAKVEHPHICRIYEVGEIDGRPFIAMQLIAGGALGATGADMSLEQKVRVLREVAEAVHVAHEAGLVHRDLKPDNILVERDDSGGWHPYVMDFGVARETSVSDLTLTGQLVGTPLYMAPEQALGRKAEVDRRTDVYALGATFYELLAQAPPFSGETVADVLLQVVEREPTPLRRRNPRVPLDLETIAMRCLRKDPAERYPTAQALAEDLGRYLDGKPLRAQRIGPLRRVAALARRNRAITATVACAILATSGVAVGLRVAAAREREEEIERLSLQGSRALEEARVARSREELLRTKAFTLFDAEKPKEAELIWANGRRLGVAIERAYARASRAFEATLALDHEWPRVRAALADSLVEWALWSEQRGKRSRLREIAERLAIYDDDGSRRARLEAPSPLSVATDPSGARVSLTEYVPDGRGKRREEPRGDLGVTPLVDTKLAPGSYVLSVQALGRISVRYPVLLSRGERYAVELALPRTDELPEGFVYVPGGRFLVGNAGEEDREWYGNPPLHEARTGPYLIARAEVTVGEWLVFLRSLPQRERERRAPKAIGSGDGVALEEIGGGVWRYAFRPDRDHLYSARTGEKLFYPRRQRRALQDWTKFPVTGVSAADAHAYASWLDRSGRLPGARLCTEAEWERGARGADDRDYPAGDRLESDDANIDETYDRLDWGPDEVGSHPASRSPFGLEDMAGNAFEWAVSSRHPGRFVARSGGYSYEAVISNVTNQTEFAPGAREASFGLRLCVSYPRGR
jgi:formylglycine-generating enzyme required for sulfatase activity/predicted Ser/Thr protein kinase